MYRRTFLKAMAAVALTPVLPIRAGLAAQSAYGDILTMAVKPDGAGYNRVDYKRLLPIRGELDAVVAGFATQNPSSMPKAEAGAFWINLYNAVTLQVVVKHYPVKSIRDIKLGGTGLFGSGPWKQKLVKVEGVDHSLDDIENGLRKSFKGPFIHYALNCASKSCPNLLPRPFTGASLQDQMRDNARDYVNHPRGVNVVDGSIAASKIYSWYADDFGGKAKLKPHWNELAEPGKATLISAAEIARYGYDWSLNDV